MCDAAQYARKFVPFAFGRLFQHLQLKSELAVSRIDFPYCPSIRPPRDDAGFQWFYFYETYFPVDRRPARTTVGVTALARGCRVEIDLIAKRGS